MLLAAPVAWDHYAAWILPLALGPLAGNYGAKAEIRRKVLVLAILRLAVIPLHWLFRAVRLPELLVAIPLWQVGLIGVLVVSVMEPLRGPTCRNQCNLLQSEQTKETG